MWRNWSKNECHRQYTPSEWSKRCNSDRTEIINDYIQRATEGSKLAKDTLRHEEGISTGLSENCKIDIFYPDDAYKPEDRPIFVFIHGGWWHMGSRTWSSWMAPSLVSSGAAVVIIGYDLTPHVTISDIIHQVTTSMVYIMHWARRNSASGIYLCGHSAGAHLAAMMCTVNWLNDYMISPSIIKGVILISGIYDLEPFLNTDYNDTVKFRHDDVSLFSPIHFTLHMSRQLPSCHYWLIVGEHEGQEFHRQSQEMYQSLQVCHSRDDAGQHQGSVTLTTLPNTDHFDIVLNLADKHDTLTKEICKFMGCVSGMMLDMNLNTDSSPHQLTTE